MLLTLGHWPGAAALVVGRSDMQLGILIVFFLVVAIAASAVVRFGAALTSERIHHSVVLHPVAHIVWFAGGLAALVLVLAWLFPPGFLGRGKEDRRPIGAITQLSNFKVQLTAFRDDNGFYPPGTNGLQDLTRCPVGATNWHGPYADSIPKDPWGLEYVYGYPGKHEAIGYPYDLISLGPPGKNSPVANWTLPNMKP